MALFKILKGQSSNLGKIGTSTEKTHEGWAYFTPDDGKFYIDIVSNEVPVIGTSSQNGANRICIGGAGLEDDFILDCGTASSWTPIVIILGMGDSYLDDEINASIYNGGDADLTDEINAIIFNGNIF